MTIEEALAEARKRFGEKVTVSETTDFGGRWTQPSTRRHTHLWNANMYRVEFTVSGQTWEETFSDLQQNMTAEMEG